MLRFCCAASMARKLALGKDDRSMPARAGKLMNGEAEAEVDAEAAEAGVAEDEFALIVRAGCVAGGGWL